jgi:hypothetical protein
MGQAAPVFLIVGDYGNSQQTAFLGGISSVEDGIAQPSPADGSHIFYVRDGLVTATEAKAPALINLFASDLTFDVTPFVPGNPQVVINSTSFILFDIDIDLVEFFIIPGTGFVSAFDLVQHTATIQMQVFLVNNLTAEDLSPFDIGAGGGTLSVNYQFVNMDPTADGAAFFPVPAGSTPVVSFILQGNGAVPEPASFTLMACGLLSGIVWWRRRRSRGVTA